MRHELFPQQYPGPNAIDAPHQCLAPPTLLHVESTKPSWISKVPTHPAHLRMKESAFLIDSSSTLSDQKSMRAILRYPALVSQDGLDRHSEHCAWWIDELPRVTNLLLYSKFDVGLDGYTRLPRANGLRSWIYKGRKFPPSLIITVFAPLQTLQATPEASHFCIISSHQSDIPILHVDNGPNRHTTK